MLQRDYLLRLIEEAAQVLAEALGLREKGAFGQALAVIDDAFSGLVGVEKAYLEELPVDETADRLIREKGLEAPQLEALAQMMLATGEIRYEMREDLAAIAWLEKARALYLALGALDPGLFSLDRMNRFSRLTALLQEIKGPSSQERGT